MTVDGQIFRLTEWWFAGNGSDLKHLWLMGVEILVVVIG